MDAGKKTKNIKKRLKVNFRRAKGGEGQIRCKVDFMGVPMGADIMSYPKNILCLGLDRPTAFARP